MNTILSDDQKSAMCKLKAQGNTDKQLATFFKIPESSVAGILNTYEAEELGKNLFPSLKIRASDDRNDSLGDKILKEVRRRGGWL